MGIAASNLHSASSQLPVAVMNVRDFDPASLWNTPGTPPNFGQMPVPHIFTMSGRFSLVSKAYLNADEALLHDAQNAERMRVDCGIMESLEARQRAVALLNWHIEPEDSKSFQQKELAEQLTSILQRTPRFVELRRNLLEATWYGRYGIALQYSSQLIGGQRRIAARRWEPRHGDKLVFRYDDGYFNTDPEEVGIRVASATSLPERLLGCRRKIQPTEQGWVYWLSPSERKTLIVHKHLIEDAPYDDPRSAGRIHGVGIRSRIYWTWYAMVECLQRALEFLDRSALGVEIWTYPANNSQAKARTEEAALNHVGGGRSVVLVPVFPDENADLYGVRHIEPGLAGIDALLNVIKEYFGHKIKRYIIGQTLTSEADATGLGSGVADAHLATLADICQYDARNLEETLTTDFLRPLQLWNFPKSAGHYLRFVIDTDEPNVKEKLESVSQAWQMGLKIKASDVADMIGISIPTDAEPAIFSPQVVQGIEAMNLAAKQKADFGESFTDSVLRSYAQPVTDPSSSIL